MDSGTITLNDNNSRGSYFSRQSCRTALDFVLNGWEKLFGVLGWLMNRNERAWVRSILHRIEHYVAWRYNIKTKWATNRIFIDLLFEASTSIIYLMFSSVTADDFNSANLVFSHGNCEKTNTDCDIWCPRWMWMVEWSLSFSIFKTFKCDHVLFLIQESLPIFC